VQGLKDLNGKFIRHVLSGKKKVVASLTYSKNIKVFKMERVNFVGQIPKYQEVSVQKLYE